MKEINIKSDTIEKGLDLAKEFLQSILKPSLDEVGELFADRVKLWRVKNQVKNIEKVKAIVEKEGIKTKAINMKVLFPYLDAVALEDDETLQDMWANLFANYIDQEMNLTLTVYPEILRQLSSEEATVLQVLFTNSRYSPIPLSSTCETSNLERLGLIKQETSTYTNLGTVSIESTGKYQLTEFGDDFVDACTRNKKSSM